MERGKEGVAGRERGGHRILCLDREGDGWRGERRG